MFTQTKVRNGYSFKFLSTILFAATFLVGGFFVANNIFAVAGEGTATINGGANVTVTKSTSNVFTVVLTVGASGITVDAANPTFTIPTGFTAPKASPVANAGLVLVDGDWSAVGGATCPVTMGSSSASGQTMTVDVTTVCTVEPTEGKIALTYKGTSNTVMGATALTIGTADSIGNSPVVPISNPPTISVADIQATPTFNPVAGAVVFGTTIIISSASADAIYYTTDGSDPTTGSTLYSTPVAINSALTLKALAVRTGYANSAIGSAVYTQTSIQATPTFSPAAGAVISGITVKISSASASAIYYTTDGSDPTTGSTLYSTPVAINSALTLKALAVRTGYANSVIGSAAYTSTTVTPFNFVEYAGNPIWGGSTAANKAYSPYVIKINGIYNMWYGDGVNARHTSSTYPDFHDAQFPGTIVTGTTASQPYKFTVYYNLNGWTLGGTYYSQKLVAYYTDAAAGWTANPKIAVSDDGITWTYVASTTGVIGYPTGYSSTVYRLSVVYEGPGVWKGYADDGNAIIQYLTSTDGINWTGVATDILKKNNPQSWESTSSGAISPYVFKAGGIYVMTYSAGLTNNNQAIGVAYSTDGINWAKSSTNPIFKISDGVSWRASRTYNSYIINDDGLWRMYFQGNSAAGAYSVGMATSETGVVSFTAYSTALSAVTSTDYTSASWTTYQSVVTANVVTIANSQTEIDTATLNITTAQSSLVTVAAEALAAAKITAHNALTTALGTYVQTKYTVENWTTLNGFKTSGDIAIDTVTTLAGVSSAQTTATAGMAGVQKLNTVQTIPDATTGEATSNPTTPEVLITNPTQAVTVTIDSGTTNPSLNFAALITNGTGTLPKINITSANANNTTIKIPVSTVVTNTDIAWNGKINAPTNVTNITLPVTVGEIKTLSTAIEVGSTIGELTFSKAVRILLPGQASKRAGYVRNGIPFTEITNTCVADNQTTGDVLATDKECKINVGTDLVIWTKHFTTFATYTQTTNSVSGSSLIAIVTPTKTTITTELSPIAIVTPTKTTITTEPSPIAIVTPTKTIITTENPLIVIVKNIVPIVVNVLTGNPPLSGIVSKPAVVTTVPENPPLFDITSAPVPPTPQSRTPFIVIAIVVWILIASLVLFIVRRITRYLLIMKVKKDMRNAKIKKNETIH